MSALFMVGFWFTLQAIGYGQNQPLTFVGKSQEMKDCLIVVHEHGSKTTNTTFESYYIKAEINAESDGEKYNSGLIELTFRGDQGGQPALKWNGSHKDDWLVAVFKTRTPNPLELKDYYLSFWNADHGHPERVRCLNLLQK